MCIRDSVVISNDARATGGSEADYWNIFEEVTIDDRVEENILEIAKGLFAEKLEHTTQPFFPNAAKDLFAALMLSLIHIYYSGRCPLIKCYL